MTILRRIMDIPSPEVPSVTALGIDDFSFKRGRNFGTILVNLSNHKVIDLLPERNVESAAAWMQRHPEIEYVSRDRGNDYTQATRADAPQATAVADRFHVLKNLIESIEPVVASCYKELRRAQEPLPAPPVSHAKEWRQASAPQHEHQRMTRLATNQGRYAEMLELQKRGVKTSEIAQRLGVTTRTIQNWIKRGGCPGSQRRQHRKSIFDPYAPYVFSRWNKGCRDVSLLHQEIQAQGFSGSIRVVYRFIQTLRHQGTVELPVHPILNRISVREALWLIAHPSDELNEAELVDLKMLCEASARLSTLHSLIQAFERIVRKREGHQLEHWKQQVAESGIAEVQRFVKGLERDKEAVLAGLTLVYSNGQ
ncbi:hypothetical protein KSB_67050 [Ktedonobacter robiniae]|uniref:HTH IS21-type domain-containing protein n=2 Tax=Ktedonobacter robiniae TaxID=2778365 RepID=A0ABQ3UZW7_9CHLR|nr:hypothetical protein KSB_67050 [Ktedonobacter robiniae]